MTKKKRGQPDLEEILARPWCYYCERDFDDLKILINHQKAKHFKCERCGRRLNTAGGLSVHMSQVHKENLSAVDNALPNRAGLDIEIFGMEGIPEDIIQQHNQRVLANFHQAEADRRAATGNPAPGVAGVGGQSKKPKVESASELKKRLAEHKAKLAAEQANGGSSGGGTPLGAGQAQPPALSPISNPFPSGSPPYPAYQQPMNGPPGASSFGPPQQYGQVPPQPPPGSMPFGNAQQYGQVPPQLPPYQQPPAGYPPQPSFSPPPPFQGQPPFGNPPFLPPGIQNGPPSFQGGFPGGPPRPFGVSSPVQPFQQQQQMAPRTHTPPQPSGFPARPPSLPPAPGLPQRPAFGAPQVNAFQLQQMHQGQVPGLPQPPPSLPSQVLTPSTQHSPSQGPTQESTDATSLDDLISGASRQAEQAAAAATAAAKAEVHTEPAAISQEAERTLEDKSTKKDKDKSKASRLIYSDNEMSPEEKMARMPRYAFIPENKAVVA